MTNRIVTRLRECATTMRERGPNAAVVASTTVAFAVLTAIVLRYVPEYLRVLGVGPVLIGAFGSVGIAAGVARTYWHRRRDTGESTEPRPNRGPFGRLWTRHRQVVAVGAATVGLAAWLLVPSLTDSAILVWTGLAGGLVLVCCHAPLSFDGTVRLDSDERNQRAGIGATGAALPAGFLVIAGLLALVPTFVAGFRLVAALGVALGLVALALRWVDRNGDDNGSGVNEFEEVDEPADSTVIRRVSGSIADVRADLWALTDESYRLLLGDTLLRATSGAVSVFLVITVTTVLGFEDTIGGLGLRPDALFAVLVAVETIVVLVSWPLAARLAEQVGAGPVAATSTLVVSLVPISLVNAPANPIVLVVLFGAYGLREAGRRAIGALVRETIEIDSGENETTDAHRIGGEGNTEGVAGDGGAPAFNDASEARRILASYRLARDVAVIPSALVGGLLFAVSPQLAFGLATAIGLLGVREVLYFLRPRRR